MKNTPAKPRSKKKRKSRGTPKRSTDWTATVLSPAYTLRPRRASCQNKSLLKSCTFMFNLTYKIRKELFSIKRVIKNDKPLKERAPDTCQISVNARVTRLFQLMGTSKIREDKSVQSRCTKQFLKYRSIKMANEAVDSSKTPFSNINITFEDMLSIRKKRLTKKHQHGTSQNREHQPNVDIEIPVVELIQLEVEQSENNNIVDKAPVIKNDRNSLEDNCIENEVQQVVAVEEKSINVIDLDPMIIEDSINLCEQTILKTTTPIRVEPEKVIDVNAVNASCGIKLTLDNVENTKIRTCSPVNNSVIIIPDTPDSNDCDIIFVSEKRKLSSVPISTQKRNRTSSIIILDDDDEINPPVTRPKKKLVVLPAINSVVFKKKKKIKRRKKIRKNKIKLHLSSAGPVATKTCSTSTSELASCAETNCMNRPKRKLSLGHTAQPCACQSSKSAYSVKPNLATIPEESATAACNNGSKNKVLLTTTVPPFNNSGSDMFSSNIYNAGCVRREGLRQIIIDGSNVALSHTNGRVFSVRGLQIAIDYFVKKGHKVRAFVPQYRVKYGQCSNPELLKQLANRRFVIFTPSREITKGRRITPYDDRYIIQYATSCEGIVVSNDNFRDLLWEKPEWRQTIERRILMHTWVDDVLMFPEDPLGRHGPTLSRFLRFP